MLASACAISREVPRSRDHSEQALCLQVLAMWTNAIYPVSMSSCQIGDRFWEDRDGAARNGKNVHLLRLRCPLQRLPRPATPNQAPLYLLPETPARSVMATPRSAWRCVGAGRLIEKIPIQRIFCSGLVRLMRGTTI
jgi:hypothetical protein